MSSINRVLRNTINSHIIQDHKYNDQDESHQLYPNEGSDGSEDDETRAIYQVVSLNTPMADSSKFDMKYLLKRPEPASTTTTTTTSKPVHPDQFLEVFVLIVNEQDFVKNNNQENFRDAVWKIFTE